MKQKLAIVVDHCKDYGGISKALENMLPCIADFFDTITVFVPQLCDHPISLPANASFSVWDRSSSAVSAYREQKMIGVAKWFSNKLAALLNWRNYQRKKIYLARCITKPGGQFDTVIAYNAINDESAEIALEKIEAGRKILWIHNRKTYPKKNIGFYTRFYSRADQIICVSKDTEDYMRASLPACRTPITTIHNFYNFDLIFAQAKEPAEDGFANAGNPCLLSVGNFFEQKGYDRIVPVVERLRGEGYPVKWYVIGNGPLRESVEKEIKDHHLEDTVILLGYRSNPYPYMRQCDLYVQPSYWEGYCTTTWEAKALKKPVLATDVQGMREQFEHGVDGWIVESSTDGLYQGIKYLLDHPEQVEAIKAHLDGEPVSNEEALRQSLAAIRGEACASQKN